MATILQLLSGGACLYLVILIAVLLGFLKLARSKSAKKTNIKGNLLVEEGTHPEGDLSSPISAPGPRPYPLIGSLHLLASCPELPYRAFDLLASTYGPVASITLGSVPCLVVSSLERVKEVLLTKGDQFDGRPDFIRYHKLFSGDKQNSLAFCDWSEIQKTRREMLRVHTFPRAFTTKFHQLDSLLTNQIDEMFNEIKVGEPTAIKPIILNTCANTFLSYFCSVQFSNEDFDFLRTVKNFDQIFYEVNQGYAADFIPWLMPLHKWHLNKMADWSHEIRDFVVEKIISKRAENWTPGQEEEDYVDALLNHVKGGKSEMPLETALFALEDIVGGHSAIGNLLVKVLAFVAKRPIVQARIQEEVDSVTRGSPVTLSDRNSMPYTEAVILEAIRHISSPIVPHVANQNSTIGGYKVKKGTLIFLNNYTLNMSPDLWTDPSEFQPERFLGPDGRISKPEHFLPFGGGRRSCMGYKMTQFISFSILASLLQRYTIRPSHDYHIPLGNLALPFDTFRFNFEKR